MTDEQLENAVKFAISELSYCAQKQINDYINRLKVENADLTVKTEALETDNANLHRTLEECNEELQTIRKETAKEILTYVGNIPDDSGIKLKDYQWHTDLCQHYRVEVSK